MDGTAITAIVVALISAFVTMFKTLLDRKNHKIKDELQLIRKDLKALRIDTTRLQLLSLIQHEPDNIDTILRVARYYFIDLKGDWYAIDIFVKWANAHGVDISEIIKFKEAN